MGSHFITKVLDEIKRLYGYTENPKSPLSSSDLKRAFQYLGGVEMNLTNSKLMMILVLSFMGFIRAEFLVAFRATLSLEGTCFPSTVRTDNYSCQSYTISVNLRVDIP